MKIGWSFFVKATKVICIPILSLLLGASVGWVAYKLLDLILK